MTIKELFDYVDEVKPNAYSNKVKTVWLNQAEGKVMTEVFLWNEAEVFEYHYEYSGSASVYFPDEHTLAFTDTTLLKNFRPGGQITKLTAPAPYSGNSFTAARTIQRISDAGLVFEESFADTGDTAATATVEFSGENVALLVDPPHSKMYAEYINAMIDYSNGEYDRYANTMTMFNDFFGEFSRWFARMYAPADRHDRRDNR